MDTGQINRKRRWLGLDVVRHLGRVRQRQSPRSRQRGSLSEMAMAIPVLLLLGLSTLQGSLIYHGKSTLNYATFEAARTGAVNHAQEGAMRHELGIRLAPLQGGDGSTERAATAILKARTFVENRLQTRIRVINPTIDAFTDWGFDDPDTGEHLIPNSHLRHQPNGVGSVSGLTLRDANLLKIEVTHGFEMKVPLVSTLLAKTLMIFDAENAVFYAQNQLPLTSVATVRMQSAAWQSAITEAAAHVAEAESESAALVDESDGDGASEADEPEAGEDGGEGEEASGDGDYEPWSPGGDDSVESCPSLSDTSNAVTAGDSTRSSKETACLGPEPTEEPVTVEEECMAIDEDGDVTAEAFGGEESQQAPEEDRGFWGDLWDEMAGATVYAYDFLRGFWAGLKNQLGDLINVIANPIETAKGLLELGKALVTNPVETVQMMVDLFGEDIRRAIDCGALGLGNYLGNWVNPGILVKFGLKLVEYGASNTAAIIRDMRRLYPECLLGNANPATSSFLAGTPVWTDSGLMPIERVVVGTQVASRSDEMFSDAMQRVSDTFGREVEQYHQLLIGNELVEVTEEHPFWVQGRGWTEARDVSIGDAIASATGDVLVFNNLLVDKTARVYNFSVEKTPSYFVGDAGLWVHNAPNPTNISKCAYLRSFNYQSIEPGRLFNPIPRPSGFVRPDGDADLLRRDMYRRYPDLRANEGGWQAHHIIPSNVYARHPLFRNPPFDAFEINSSENGVALAQLPVLGVDRPSQSTTTHSGSHPGYDAAVRDFLNQIQAMDDKDAAMDVLKEGMETIREMAQNNLARLNNADRTQGATTERLSRADVTEQWAPALQTIIDNAQ